MIAKGDESLPDDEEEPQKPSDDSGGVGGRERAESGLSVVQDARLTARAIEKGWLKGPWETAIPASAIDARARAEGREMTLIEKTLVTVDRCLDSPREIVQIAAVKAVVAMEGQNQRERLPAAGITVNGGASIQIIDSTDWYGNDAHSRVAKATAPHAAGALEPGKVQGADLRPTLEQDGNGPASRN